MTQTATTYADLLRTHAGFRAYVDNFTSCPFISLNGLWDLGGRVPESEPLAWLDRRCDQNFGQVMALESHVVADEHGAWEYLLGTDPAVAAAALAENERSVAADPIRCALYLPSAAIVGIALRHFARALGLDCTQAGEAFMAEVVARTIDQPELHRETQVAQIRRSIRDNIVLQAMPRPGGSAEPATEPDIAGGFAGLPRWYLPKPELTFHPPSVDLSLHRSPQAPG